MEEKENNKIRKPNHKQTHNQAIVSFELLQNCSLRINAHKGPPPEWDLCNCIFWPFANIRPQLAKNTVGLKPEQPIIIVRLRQTRRTTGLAFHQRGRCSPPERFNQPAGRCAPVRACTLGPAVASSIVRQHRGRSETKMNGWAKAIFTQHLNIPYAWDWRACW